MKNEPKTSIKGYIPDDPNRGTGWFEFIKQPGATTHIIYVGEYGDYYIPEEDVRVEDFLNASVRNEAYRLVRANEVPR